MKILVCTKCCDWPGKGKKACTLFFPDEERRDQLPSMCGPDKEGFVRMITWSEAPEEFIKVMFR